MKKLFAAALLAAGTAFAAGESRVGGAVVTTPDGLLTFSEGGMSWTVPVAGGPGSAQISVTADAFFAHIGITGAVDVPLLIGLPGKASLVSWAMDIVDDKGSTLYSNREGTAYWIGQNLDAHRLNITFSWDYTPGFQWLGCEAGLCRQDDGDAFAHVHIASVQSIPEPAAGLLLLLGLPLLAWGHGRSARCART